MLRQHRAGDAARNWLTRQSTAHAHDLRAQQTWYVKRGYALYVASAAYSNLLKA